MKRICVFGLGGIGGYVGAKLDALASRSVGREADLAFVARGRHLEAVKKNGLLYVPPEGEPVTVRPGIAVSDPAEIGPVDVVFLCVKGYDLPASAEALRPLLGPATVVIPLLNGIDVYERIDSALGSAMVLPSCIYISSVIKEPGVVTHMSGKGSIESGFDPKRKNYDPSFLITAMGKAGIPFTWHEDSQPALWTKYLFIAAYALVTGMSGKPIGGVLEAPELAELVLGILAEIKALADAKGVALPADIVQASFDKGKAFAYGTKTSYQRDLEVPGKPNEGDLFGGTILKLGKELGVPTPVTEKVYGRIQSRG